VTATELVRLLHGKRYKRGCWFAKCPVHVDKTASLSIRDMGKRIAIKCFGCGANGTQVMKALGMTAADLFSDARIMSPEIKARMDLENRLESMEKRAIECAAQGYFLDTGRRNYWLASERRLMTEIQAIKDKLEPDSTVYRERKAKLDKFVAKYGWDVLWSKFLEDEKGRSVAARWGLQ
jgi:hypothetical protein